MRTLSKLLLTLFLLTFAAASWAACPEGEKQTYKGCEPISGKVTEAQPEATQGKVTEEQLEATQGKVTEAQPEATQVTEINILNVIGMYKGKMSWDDGESPVTTTLRRGMGKFVDIGGEAVWPNGTEFFLTSRYKDDANRALLFGWSSLEPALARVGKGEGLAVFWFSSNYESFEGTWGFNDSYEDGGFWVGESKECEPDPRTFEACECERRLDMVPGSIEMWPRDFDLGTGASGTYVGQMENRKFHGKGCLTYDADGSEYIGEFKAGKKHGQGTLTYADGRTIRGTWKDGQPLKRGILTDADGSEYIGEFKNGKRHGQGTWTKANGDEYVGGWKDGKRHGQGTYIWTNGDKYIGQWESGKRQGSGTYTNADGKVEEGMWDNDVFLYASIVCLGSDNKSTWTDCLGALTHANGDEYVGEFKDGKRHGQGTLTYADGRKIRGEWKDGQPLKRGILTDVNGDEYVGEFKDGKKHGTGVETRADGSQFIGKFKNDQLHGRAIMSRAPDGSTYRGEWNEGRPQQGTWTMANGNEYVGEFKDGNMHGQGTYIWANGDEYVGGWKEGQLHGQGTRTKANGDEYVGGWKDNAEHGQGILTYADGTVVEGLWNEGQAPPRTLTTFVPGVEYAWYDDGSCTEYDEKVCVSKETMKTLCTSAVGITHWAQRVTTAFDEVAGHLFENGGYRGQKVYLADYGCRAGIYLEGMYEGSSYNLQKFGDAGSFIVGDEGDVIVSSIINVY